ncbi:Serine/threonine protein kinase [Saitoella coloradoensis]
MSVPTAGPPPPATQTQQPQPTPESRLGHLLDNRLELLSILGLGAYGVVYTAQDIYTHQLYAVKALSKLALDARARRFQAREIALHAKAQRHPNVVSLVEILDAPDCVYVVMEYCPEGDLFAIITEGGGYVGDDELCRRVFLQLLDAVEYCHNHGIYHRDLKPENVLVTDGGLTVKLADFGLATTEVYTSDFGCGSTFYMSPECQTPIPSSARASAPAFYSSPANDVWSLGVILVNLTCGRNPWKRATPSDETYNAYLSDRHFLRSILPLSRELNAILMRVFEPEVARRCTVGELRQAIETCGRFTIGVGEVEEIIPTPVPEVDVEEELESYYYDTQQQQVFVCPPTPLPSHRHGQVFYPPPPRTPQHPHHPTFAYAPQGQQQFAFQFPQTPATPSATLARKQGQPPVPCTPAQRGCASNVHGHGVGAECYPTPRTPCVGSHRRAPSGFSVSEDDDEDMDDDEDDLDDVEEEEMDESEWGHVVKGGADRARPRGVITPPRSSGGSWEQVVSGRGRVGVAY